MCHRWNQSNQSMFYFMSVHIEVIIHPNLFYYTNLPAGLCTINLTIKIIISVSYKMSLTLLQSLKSYPFFWSISVVIGHSSSMCLTDKIFLQHVTFCEYLVFHEFRRNLYITLAKYLEQEGIADLSFWSFDTQSSQVLMQSHTTKVVGYFMIFQTCFSLHLV